MNENQLAKYKEALLPAAAGDTNKAQAMIQMGQLYGIPENDLIAENIGALAKVASWCLEYGYLPGLHVGMLSHNKSEKVGNEWIKKKIYTPYITYDQWRANLSAHARINNVEIFHETQELEPEEVKAYVDAESDKSTGPYHEGDRGARVRLITVLGSGREIEGEWHYGFWRANAYYDNYTKKYKPDTIPNQRSRQWVAFSRAHKSAIKSVAAPVPIAAAFNTAGQVNAIANMAQEAERERNLKPETPTGHEDAMIAFKQHQREEDGDILFAEENPKHRRPEPEPEETIIEGEFHEVGLTDIVDDPDVPTATRTLITAIRNHAKENADYKNATKKRMKDLLSYTGNGDPELGKRFCAEVFLRDVDENNPINDATADAILNKLNPEHKAFDPTFPDVIVEVLNWNQVPA